MQVLRVKTMWLSRHETNHQHIVRSNRLHFSHRRTVQIRHSCHELQVVQKHSHHFITTTPSFLLAICYFSSPLLYFALTTLVLMLPAEPDFSSKNLTCLFIFLCQFPTDNNFNTQSQHLRKFPQTGREPVRTQEKTKEWKVTDAVNLRQSKIM